MDTLVDCSKSSEPIGSQQSQLKSSGTCMVYPVLMALFLCAGVVLSFLALQVHVTQQHGAGNGQSFCNVSQTLNCDAVIASKWSSLFGIPIAAFGLVYYLWLLLLLVPSERGSQQPGRLMYASLSFLSLIASVVLFAVSHWIIGVLCPLCLGLYAVNIFMAVTAWLAIRGRGAQLRSLPSLTRRSFLGKAVSALVVSVVASIGIHQSLEKSVEASIAPRTGGGSDAADYSGWPTTSKLNFELSDSSGGEEDFFRGDTSAKIYITEFADIECPYCRQLYVALKPVLERFESQVFFVFKNFPLDKSCNLAMPQEGHKYACKLAEFARCAGEQGEYWATMDVLMASQLPTHAKDAGAMQKFMDDVVTMQGLDAKAVSECIASGRQRNGISRDIEQGRELQLTGTPSIYINGKLVENPTVGSIQRILQTLSAQSYAQ
jgi:protein-disulfide isomerase/uncharacterized membrane protein